MSMYDNGIIMTNGFSIASKKPADLKYLADTIQDRDKYVTDNLAYEGMLVYVKVDKITYQYLGNNTWKEFGFNTQDFENNLYNGLDSSSTTLGLSANQGKVLNDKMTVHINSSTHITDEERAIWNAKASSSLVSQTDNGLMSASDKKKLDSIDEGANNYLHPETHPATMIEQDSTHRFVTDEERDTWNAKASTDIATQDKDGLMSADDKLKLDSIDEMSGSYTHPETHPATMIVEDETHRFVTDQEKEQWNNLSVDIPLATEEQDGLMSADDKLKLDSIDEMSGSYTHPEYNSYIGEPQEDQSPNFGDSFIITQPISNNLGHITAMNQRLITIPDDLATQDSSGLMSPMDKKKLDSIEEYINYEHPETHPATMIVEDDTHKFVTAEQINTWNALIEEVKIIHEKLKTAVFYD